MAVAFPFADPFGQPSSVIVPLAAMGPDLQSAGASLSHERAPVRRRQPKWRYSFRSETVAATTWAWIAFAEAPSGRTIVGGTIVIVAVLWGTFGRLLREERR